MQGILGGNEELEFFRELIRNFATENACSTEDAAASLAVLLQRNRPLQPPPDTLRPPRPPRPRMERDRDRDDRRPRPSRLDDSELERYRIQVGRDHGANPGHIVGAIANEAGLDSRSIGRIQLYDKYSTVDLPRGMPRHVLQHLRKVRIFQQPLAIQRDSDRRPGGPPAGVTPRRFDKGKKFGGKPAGPRKFGKGPGKTQPKR